MNAMAILNAKMSAQMKTKMVLQRVLQEMMPAEGNNVPDIRLDKLPTGAGAVNPAVPPEATSDVYNASNAA